MVRSDTISNTLLIRIIFSTILSVILFSAPSAYAAKTWLSDDVDIDKAGYTLFLILVLAILLETGLSTIFNWRVYLRYFEERGLKVPIAVIASLIFVTQFKIDAVAEVLNSFSEVKYDPGIAGKILTALIIAGGSNGVFTLYEKLGIRNPLERKGVAAGMRQQCSFKIQLIRSEGQQNNLVTVLIDKKIIGIIKPNENKFGGMLGYTFEPGEHKISLKSRDKDGKEIDGEKTITVAPGAAITEIYQLLSDKFVL